MALHPGRMVEVPERQPYVRWTTAYYVSEEMRNMDLSLTPLLVLLVVTIWSTSGSRPHLASEGSHPPLHSWASIQPAFSGKCAVQVNPVSIKTFNMKCMEGKECPRVLSGERRAGQAQGSTIQHLVVEAARRGVDYLVVPINGEEVWRRSSYHVNCESETEYGAADAAQLSELNSSVTKDSAWNEGDPLSPTTR